MLRFEPLVPAPEPLSFAFLGHGLVGVLVDLADRLDAARRIVVDAFSILSVGVPQMRNPPIALLLSAVLKRTPPPRPYARTRHVRS
jgi:hypothetical protein